MDPELTTVHPNGSSPVPAVSPVPTAAPLVYSRQELAAALNIGLATLDRHDSAGRLPRAIRLGGRKVWLRSEIAEWLQAGAPDRKTWDALRAVRKR